MKINKPVLLVFGLLILASSHYRVWPERPFGFAPQWAMAVFAGAIVKDKKLAFLLPLLSMLLSDTVYQILYANGMSQIWGFYGGQWLNYLLFASLTVFGFMIAKRVNFVNVLAASLAAPSAFFLLSNFTVWASGGGYHRPMNGAGLLQCYADGLPFYQMSLIATPLFSAVLFGIYSILRQSSLQDRKQMA